jgi:hypothetical protein
MSTYELLLCFYNGLIFKRAKFLYQYYNLLENVNLEELIDESDCAYYADEMIVNGVIAKPIIFKAKSDW